MSLSHPFFNNPGYVMEEIIGKLTVKIVFFKRTSDGTVFVYKMEKGDDSGDIFFNDFYIATYEAMRSEEIWGLGCSIERALESAKAEWERTMGEDYPNPFEEALKKLKKGSNT